MASCCEEKSCEVAALRAQHGRILLAVLGINAAMFVLEGVAGWWSHSTSLLADALDMFGDAMVYGFSLFVLNRSARWQARAALAKGGFMLLFGLGVLAEALHKVLSLVVPDPVTMSMTGAVALAANLICFALLFRHRADNLNMSSTWACSRNDLIANVGVLFAAAATYLSASRWPDIAVGGAIAAIFLRSAYSVSRDALREMRRASGRARTAATASTIVLHRTSPVRPGAGE